MKHYCTDPIQAPLCSDCDNAKGCKSYHNPTPIIEVEGYCKLISENGQLKSQLQILRIELAHLKTKDSKLIFKDKWYGRNNTMDNDNNIIVTGIKQLAYTWQDVWMVVRNN